VTFKQLRERAQLTQEALADVSGVHQTTVSQIETGKIRSPQYATVAALAKALNTTPEVVANAISESEAA
jgi:transcriptional regulator with XRE-family HTH domain